MEGLWERFFPHSLSHLIGWDPLGWDRTIFYLQNSFIIVIYLILSKFVYYYIPELFELFMSFFVYINNKIFNYFSY